MIDALNRPIVVLRFLIMLVGSVLAGSLEAQEAPEYRLVKRSIIRGPDGAIRKEPRVVWDSKKTAVIVCDVWDYHHSINAVRRLEEMLPRMEQLLQTARKSGSLVIHSPSDCMPYYLEHPARVRAERIEKTELPAGIDSWNCQTIAELAGVYPLDQSDGGDDDEPSEHLQWSKKLEALGRNPSLPWQAQNPAISIDPQRDYISDRGDEVWAILKANAIEHVIMIGVHTNMCVLGRPFGLRQLVRNEVDVVLVRDLTDCMYNPKSWPFVDHFTGNDLMIGYIEQFVCPTITSDQIIGGGPVVFLADRRTKRDVTSSGILFPDVGPADWKLTTWVEVQERLVSHPADGLLLRCSLRIPQAAFEGPVTISNPWIKHAWLNGKQLEFKKGSSSVNEFQIVPSQTFGNDDANLLVLQIDAGQASQRPDVTQGASPPSVLSSLGAVTLSEGWQVKSTWEQGDTNLPLPAKFALPPAVYYAVPGR
jgi:nicotinamidase-related amidase